MKVLYDEGKCKHQNFIDSLGAPQSNREYWIITEIFTYLHNGKDECDCIPILCKTKG